MQPPASAAEHVNSCDQIAAQLTAFTCAPTLPISKGEILAWLHPTDSRLVTRTRLFRGSDGAPWSLFLYDSLGVGQRVSRQRQPRRRWDLWLALFLSPWHEEPVAAVGVQTCRQAFRGPDPAGAG